jgi:hypothetical protein
MGMGELIRRQFYLFIVIPTLPLSFSINANARVIVYMQGNRVAVPVKINKV